jgi:hypothetical protein
MLAARGAGQRNHLAGKCVRYLCGPDRGGLTEQSGFSLGLSPGVEQGSGECEET